jgi:UDP-glucose 4-epimerase
MLLHLTGSSLQPEYHDARQVANVQSRRAAVEKAEQKLGFKTTVCLEEGLRKLIRWRELVKPVLIAESA